MNSVTSQAAERGLEVSALSPSAGREKIRLAYIISAISGGGAEFQLVELLRHLDRGLFSTSLILMDGSNAGDVAAWIEDCLILNIPAGKNSHWIRRSFSLAGAVNRIRAKFGDWRTEVAHAFLPGPSILAGAAARLAHVPAFIGSRRSLVTLYRPRRGMSAWADRLAFHFAKVNVGNSQAVTQEMIAPGGCPSEKCLTIHNGVDTERFKPRESRSWRAQMGWNDHHVIFGIVANFRACKRHGDFVEAASLISRTHAEARFVMVGGDLGNRDGVLQQVRRLGLEEKLKTIDRTASAEEILAAIDVCVCPSESEGFSNVLLEAMACGKPVIATNVGGNPEAVIDGKTGLLVPVGNPVAIADAATRLIADTALRASLGRCARQRVVDCFSVDRMVQSYQQLYFQLHNRHNQP